MARFGEEDEGVFMDEFVVPVRYGSKLTKGIMDEEERVESDETGAGVVVIVTTLLVPTSEFTAKGALYGVTVNSSLEIDGTDYTVHDKHLQGDGLFTQLMVARS